MSVKLVCTNLLVAALVAVAGPALCQTVYDASEGKLPLSAGIGVSNFDPYFAQGPAPNFTNEPGLGHGRMWGATAWVDVGIRYGRPWMQAFSVEGQYRMTFTGSSSPTHPPLKEDTIGGGLTYTVRRWRMVHPYAKFLGGVGQIHFEAEPLKNGGYYNRDSRGEQSLGGGVEVRCTNHLWARGEYEYQTWGRLLGAANLQPQGFTVGAMYHFARSR